MWRVFGDCFFGFGDVTVRTTSGCTATTSSMAQLPIFGADKRFGFRISTWPFFDVYVASSFVTMRLWFESRSLLVKIYDVSGWEYECECFVKRLRCWCCWSVGNDCTIVDSRCCCCLSFDVAIGYEVLMSHDGTLFERLPHLHLTNMLPQVWDFWAIEGRKASIRLLLLFLLFSFSSKGFSTCSSSIKMLSEAKKTIRVFACNELLILTTHAVYLRAT